MCNLWRQNLKEKIFLRFFASEPNTLGKKYYIFFWFTDTYLKHYLTIICEDKNWKKNVLTSLLRWLSFAVDEKRICTDESILMNENVWWILNFEERFSRSRMLPSFRRMLDDHADILETRVQRLNSLERHGPEITITNY